MDEQTGFSVNRRQFLGTAGGAVAAAVTTASLAGEGAAHPLSGAGRAADTPKARKKILIGVFDPVYEKLSLDEMLDKVSALGLEAMEIGTGGISRNESTP